MTEHEIKQRAGGRQWLKQQADDAEMSMVFLDKSPNSRRALEASEYARRQGKHEEFYQSVFQKFFGEGQDLGSWDLLRAAAEDVGLNADEMQQETEAGKYTQIVEDYLDTGRQLGITGVPTFIFDDRYAIVGAQPYDIFHKVMDKVKQSQKDAEKTSN